MLERINAVHAVIRRSGLADSEKQLFFVLAPSTLVEDQPTNAAAINMATLIEEATLTQHKRMTHQSNKLSPERLRGGPAMRSLRQVSLLEYTSELWNFAAVNFNIGYYPGLRR